MGHIGTQITNAVHSAEHSVVKIAKTASGYHTLKGVESLAGKTLHGLGNSLHKINLGGLKKLNLHGVGDLAKSALAAFGTQAPQFLQTPAAATVQPQAPVVVSGGSGGGGISPTVMLAAGGAVIAAAIFLRKK